MGIWRTSDALDSHGIRPSVLPNSAVVDAYPQIVAAGLTRDWVWLAHGRTNSILHTDMPIDEERRVLREITETVSGATGRRPVGWMGPGLTETHHTPDLLLFAKGFTGPEFVQVVKDRFNQLRVDSAVSGRVMALALHPFVIGQPFRHRYREEALAYLAAQADAWLTTSGDIAAHFLAGR